MRSKRTGTCRSNQKSRKQPKKKKPSGKSEIRNRGGKKQKDVTTYDLKKKRKKRKRNVKVHVRPRVVKHTKDPKTACTQKESAAKTLALQKISNTIKQLQKTQEKKKRLQRENEIEVETRREQAYKRAAMQELKNAASKVKSWNKYAREQLQNTSLNASSKSEEDFDQFMKKADQIQLDIDNAKQISGQKINQISKQIQQIQEKKRLTLEQNRANAIKRKEIADAKTASEAQENMPEVPVRRGRAQSVYQRRSSASSTTCNADRTDEEYASAFLKALTKVKCKDVRQSIAALQGNGDALCDLATRKLTGIKAQLASKAECLVEWKAKKLINSIISNADAFSNLPSGSTIERKNEVSKNKNKHATFYSILEAICKVLNLPAVNMFEQIIRHLVNCEFLTSFQELVKVCLKPIEKDTDFKISTNTSKIPNEERFGELIKNILQEIVDDSSGNNFQNLLTNRIELATCHMTSLKRLQRKNNNKIKAAADRVETAKDVIATATSKIDSAKRIIKKNRSKTFFSFTWKQQRKAASAQKLIDTAKKEKQTAEKAIKDAKQTLEKAKEEKTVAENLIPDQKEEIVEQKKYLGVLEATNNSNITLDLSSPVALATSLGLFDN